MWPAVAVGKWEPMTRIGWSAHSAKRAGEQGGLRVVVAERPVGVRHLARVVGYVASDRRPLALGIDHHADVARRVADGRRKPDLRRDRVVWLYELSEAGVEDRLGVIFTRPTCQLSIALLPQGSTRWTLGQFRPLRARQTIATGLVQPPDGWGQPHRPRRRSHRGAPAQRSSPADPSRRLRHR